jgi:hypothetical protein
VPKRARPTRISSASTAKKKLRQFVIAGIGEPQNRLRDGDELNRPWQVRRFAVKNMVLKVK